MKTVRPSQRDVEAREHYVSDPEQLRTCTNCVCPETKDGITFDDEGVCDTCNSSKLKFQVVDWDERRRMLDDLCDRIRGKHAYDCLIPFSGGKDSTYTLWFVVTQLNLRPLVVSFDHGFYRRLHLENRERTLNKLGVDFITLKANWKVVRELMRESLKRKGDFCWHCHCGVYAGSMRTAINYKVPLVFWGQPNPEYGSQGYSSYEEIEELTEMKFNRYVNLGITAEDMVGMLPDWVTLRDLDMFRFPTQEELDEAGIYSPCLGSYIPWDTRKMAATIREELGWQFNTVEGIPPEYGWEKVECMFTGVRDYLKFIKRGFGRTVHLASIDIREGNLTRSQGMELVRKYDGLRPASLDLLLEIMGLGEEEFMEMALSNGVTPYRHDPGRTKRAEPLWDQPEWRTMLGLT